MGMVIRKGMRASILAKAVKFPGVKSPLIVEFLSIKEALLWCISAGIITGEIRPDSKAAANLVSLIICF